MDSGLPENVQDIIAQNVKVLEDLQRRSSYTSVKQLQQKQSSIELIHEGNISNMLHGKQEVVLNKEELLKKSSQDEQSFFKTQQNASSGTSAGEVRILDEAKQAIQEFEKFNRNNFNNSEILELIRSENQSFSEHRSEREADFQGHSRKISKISEGHSRKVSELVIEEEPQVM